MNSINDCLPTKAPIISGTIVQSYPVHTFSKYGKEQKVQNFLALDETTDDYFRITIWNGLIERLSLTVGLKYSFRNFGLKIDPRYSTKFDIILGEATTVDIV